MGCVEGSWSCRSAHVFSALQNVVQAPVQRVARVWARYRGRPWLRAIERGLAPVAAGLILAASLTVLQAAQGGWLAWAVAGLSTAVLTAPRASPFLLLGGGALIFLALST